MCGDALRVAYMFALVRVHFQAWDCITMPSLVRDANKRRGRQSCCSGCCVRRVSKTETVPVGSDVMARGNATGTGGTGAHRRA